LFRTVVILQTKIKPSENWWRLHYAYFTAVRCYLLKTLWSSSLLRFDRRCTRWSREIVDGYLYTKVLSTKRHRTPVCTKSGVICRQPVDWFPNVDTVIPTQIRSCIWAFITDIFFCYTCLLAIMHYDKTPSVSLLCKDTLVHVPNINFLAAECTSGISDN
jgi:hypothetical protein